MVKRQFSILLVLISVSVAAYANTTPSANCTPFPATFPSSVGSTTVSCPAFTVPGGTLTSATLSYRADYQFGTSPSNTIQVVFTPSGPSSVVWSPASMTLTVTGTVVNGMDMVTGVTGSASTTGTITAAEFASAFNVAVSSSVVAGGADTSSGAVSVVYTYTPPPTLTLACPASTGTVGVPYNSALVASGGVPPYGPFAITAGSISPLTLNTSTGAITGTPTAAGTLTFTGMVTDSISDTATTTPTSCTITISPTITLPATSCNPSSPVFTSGVTDAFQIRYAANLNAGDSFVDITNSGASSGSNGGGNICVNAYTFDAAEELISCCACEVTPNGLQSISVLSSLISNPLTPAIPSSVVIKLVASVPGTGALASGLLAWGTTLHSLPTAGFGVSEAPFATSTLSPAELTHITSTCGFIQSNGSGFGICKGCSAGGLGASSAVQ